MRNEDLLRVFVVGCPRSGTTLLQSFLGASDSLTTFTESHFFDKHFRGRKYYSILAKDPTPRILEFLSENVSGTDSTYETDFLLCKSPMDCGRRLISLLDDLALSRGKTGWVEKTPDHLFRIPLINRLSPSARFVHIIREPNTTIMSLYKASRQWGKERSWLTVAAKWSYSVRLSKSYSRENRRHYAVFYEDILERPEQEIRNLFKWLGLRWRDDVLDRYTEVAGKVKTPTEVWKSNNCHPLKTSRVESKEGHKVPGWIMRLLERQYADLHSGGKR